MRATPAVDAAQGCRHQTKGKSSSLSRSKLGIRSEPDWALYESLKSQYTASTTTSAEYEAARRRAVQEAGV
jgi:hypothetical protein